jgi:tripartite-type tricarboxylate transporter receptor subunit TctC
MQGNFINIKIFGDPMPVVRILVSILLALIASMPVAASAQSTFPGKPLKFVVPFPAGSGIDATARFIGQKIAQQTGQPVIIENTPGANGFIAAHAVAKAAPDGYTIFVTAATTQVLNPLLFNKLPYDPVKDFAPVSRISIQPMLLVVRASNTQLKTVQDLTALSKKSPGKLAFASGNATSRIAGELFNQLTGADMLHVPYKGVPQGLIDLLGGQVDVMFPDLATGVTQIKSGTLRALAITGANRAASLPDVPTMAEAGLAGFDLFTWTAAYVPAKTPKPVIDRINELFNAALTSADAAKFFGVSGNTPLPSSPAELDTFTKSELEKWGRIVRAANIPRE